MKSIRNILIAVGLTAIAGGMMTSCVDDLNVEPSDPSTITYGEFSQDPEGYMTRVMADIYMSFCVHGPNNNSQVDKFDGGMSTFQRAIFNLEELASDEACWLSTDDAPMLILSYGNPTADNRAVFGAYSRLMINVALCNQFIQTVNAGQFYLDTPELKAKGDEFIRQAKVLRSACYFYLINFFGDALYADENVPMNGRMPQMPRAEIFDLVTATLEEVVAEYDANPVSTPYGYVGKDLAEGMLVKFYLNAEVFTGTPMWNECFNMAQKLIGEHRGTGFSSTNVPNSGLAYHYLQNFAANNDELAIGGSNPVNEILWVLPEKYPEMLTYGGASLMLLGWISPDLAGSFYNAGNGWRCMLARTQFSKKMEWGDDTYTWSYDERLANWQTAANVYDSATGETFSIDNPNLNQADWGKNGYLAVKFRNYTMDDNGVYDFANPAPFDGDGYVSCDYPMLRLSEIYLSAAEAALNGGGDRQTALDYVNLIRERAGLDPWEMADLNYDKLQDERCRELYTECTRRTDLIRYGKWISGYNWNWKAGAPLGANFNPSYLLYPFPPEVISAGYRQNTGY